MNDDSPAIGGRIARIGLIALAGLGALFGAGVTAGLIGARLSRGGAFDLKQIALVAVAALFTAGCAYGAYRAMRTVAKVSGAPTSRERRNYIVLAVCGAMGGVMGLVLSLAGPSPFSAFSNEPLAPALALAMAFPIAVLMPILCLYWHYRVADEQEAAAYGKGALIGIYTYFIGAPIWWLLWRGGFLPAPDGIIIYFTVITVTGVIWLWAKYR